MTDSGHGGQTKDLDGDEADGYDEVIYPLDFQQAGHIVDDVWASSSYNIPTNMSIQMMHDIMVKPLPPGCRLTAIFDVSPDRAFSSSLELNIENDSHVTRALR